MRNKCFLLILCLSLGSILYAQKDKVKNDVNFEDEPYHFGYTLGINVMDFAITPNSPLSGSNKHIVPVVANPQAGFHVSALASFRLNDYFSIRTLPGLSFGQRSIIYSSGQYDSYGPDSLFGVAQTIDAANIEVPLLLKYRALRINNWAPFVLGGFNLKYDLLSKNNFVEDKDLYIKVKPLNYALDYGAGIDFYLPYFKFSIELKMSLGLNDILVHEPYEEYPESAYTDAIKSLKTSTFMISFHFE
ncbi:PorT family protein [Bacteroidales bacterium]|nr:PorT family protein [Bacteroidales bacterium]